MPHTITLPGKGKKLKTQDMILSILASEFPLTAKQLTNKIRKQFASSVTFQGVYKAITQLLNDRVLEKEGTALRINKTWIKETKLFVDTLQKTYLEAKEKPQGHLVGEDVQIYYLDNLIDLDKFWIRVFEEWFDDPSVTDKLLVQQCGHAWYIFGHLEHEQKTIDKMREVGLKFYTVSDGDTFLDQWAGKYYTREGSYYTTRKHSNNSLHNHYYIIYGNYIMESVYPEALARELEEIYKSVKTIKDLDLNKMIKVLHKKAELKITVMRSEPLARKLQDELLSQWKS